MATTYEKIASVTVGSGGAATIDFTSIPGTFDDLVIKFSLRSDDASIQSTFITFNSLTTNFSSIYIQGESTNVSTGTLARYVSGLSPSTYTANTFGNSELYIPNYTSSTYKSYSSNWSAENNAAFGYNGAISGLWSNTAAITSISLVPGGGNFVQYSTAVLYGIKKS